MNTFLPYPNYIKTAKCLDYKRLGKQRLETLWLIKSIINETSRVKTHPLVLMWKDYIESLILYGCAMCDEWMERGYVDNLKNIITSYSKLIKPVEPFWLNDINLIASHRSNLLRKDQNWYNVFGWKESNDLPYYWPVNKYNYEYLKGRNQL